MAVQILSPFTPHGDVLKLAIASNEDIASNMTAATFLDKASTVGGLMSQGWTHVRIAGNFKSLGHAPRLSQLNTVCVHFVLPSFVHVHPCTIAILFCRFQVFSALTAGAPEGGDTDHEDLMSLLVADSRDPSKMFLGANEGVLRSL
jgi:hypothetical protein